MTLKLNKLLPTVLCCTHLQILDVSKRYRSNSKDRMNCCQLQHHYFFSLVHFFFTEEWALLVTHSRCKVGKRPKSAEFSAEFSLILSFGQGFRQSTTSSFVTLLWWAGWSFFVRFLAMGCLTDTGKKGWGCFRQQYNWVLKHLQSKNFFNTSKASL